MALHFVPSAVISEGADGELVEEVLDTEETRRQRLKAEQDGKQSLYLQLAARQAAKDDEYEANRKMILGGAKVDEEDVAFFEELDAKQALRKNARAQEEEKLVEGFRAAKSEAMYSTLSQQPSADSVPVALVIPAKVDKSSSALDTTSLNIVKKRRRAEEGGAEVKVDAGAEVRPSSITEPQPSAPPSVLATLAAYGSDDD
jgi:hypothetical protein